MVFYLIIKFYVINDKVFFFVYCIVLYVVKLRGIILNLDVKFIDFFVFVYKSVDVMEWDVLEKN